MPWLPQTLKFQNCLEGPTRVFLLEERRAS